MAPLADLERTKFITPSEPFCAICVPARGKYSVAFAFPLNCVQICGNCFARYAVSWYVDPDPSECTTGMIGKDGSARPLLSAVTAASFQLVMPFVKIFASVWPESRRLLTCFPPTTML